MTVNLGRANMRVDPPPRIERLLGVNVFLVGVIVFLVGVMFMMGFVVVMIMQVMAIHVYAAVEVAVRLPHHRARNVLLGVAEQHGQEVAPRKRLRHARGRCPREQSHKQRENRQQAVWKQSFHRRLRLRRKRAASNRTAE